MRTPVQQLRVVVVGWILAMLLPLAIYWLARGYALSISQSYYLMSFGACLVLMTFNLVPHYAAVLGAVLTCLSLDVVPVDIGLSGFASGGFLMALSVFGLGSVLSRSGLATRLIALILRYCPHTRGWQNLAILLAGVLLTICVPSPQTRVALLAPLVKHATGEFGYPEHGREATQMMASMFVGCSIFSPIFLTGQTLNVILYEMLPQQISNQVQWGEWLRVSAAWGVLCVLGYVLVTSWWFRHGRQPLVPTSRPRAQLEPAGPMTSAEWVALFGVILFVVATTSYSFHKINLFWIGFGVFCVFLVVEALTDAHIQRDVAWDVMLLIGFFISLENIFVYLGIGGMITAALSGVTDALNGNVYLFAACIAAIVLPMRLALPTTSVGVLAAAVCLPLAKANSFDQWLTCFIIMVLAEFWWWPKQASYVATYTAACDNEPIHEPRLFQHLNLLTIAIRVIALLAFIGLRQLLGQT